MSKKLSIQIGNHSDKGMVRETNQDSFGSAKTDWGELFVVADGMGGHKGGEIASKITVDALCNSFKSEKVSNPLSFLNESIINADLQVKENAEEKPELKGMGTTVVALIVKDGKAFYAHVGDSRIYLFRHKKALQLTKDHSYVQQLVDEGTITPKEAEDHPMKNRILQAIGGEKTKPDLNSETLYQDDILLLCTDGLSGEVSADEMWENVKSSKPMDACKTLVDLANERGGPDNSTVIIVRIEKGPKPPPVTTIQPTPTIKINEDEAKQSNLTNIILGVVVGIGIILFLLTYNKKVDIDKPLIAPTSTQPDSSIIFGAKADTSDTNKVITLPAVKDSTLIDTNKVQPPDKPKEKENNKDTENEEESESANNLDPVFNS